MEIKITFPGGKKVNAEINGMTITTDQPVKYGGSGTAPSPYEHFLASLGTCAGIFILGFCQERSIPFENISLVEKIEYANGPDGRPYMDKIVLEVGLPPEFPEKYRNAIIKVADQCAVKRTIMNPPKIEVKTV